MRKVMLAALMAIMFGDKDRARESSRMFRSVQFQNQRKFIVRGYSHEKNQRQKRKSRRQAPHRRPIQNRK